MYRSTAIKFEVYDFLLSFNPYEHIGHNPPTQILMVLGLRKPYEILSNISYGFLKKLVTAHILPLKCFGESEHKNTC